MSLARAVISQGNRTERAKQLLPWIVGGLVLIVALLVIRKL
jgi:hypothetical protein